MSINKNLEIDMLKIINKVDILEQKIINLNAKLKFKMNEIELILEDRHDDE